MTWNRQGERVVAREILLAQLRRRHEDGCRNYTRAARTAREAFEADIRDWLEIDDALEDAAASLQTDSPATARPEPRRRPKRPA